MRPIIDEVEASHKRRTKTAQLKRIDSVHLRNLLSGVANWLRFDKREEKLLAADPPPETAAFRLLYTLIVLSHERRRVIHFDVTQYPTQDWLARQMTEAFPWDTAPGYLLRDRDASYGVGFRDRVRVMGIKPRSPWQNPYIERLIGSIRRECLDHIILFNEHHSRGVLSSYFQSVVSRR